MVNIEEGRIRTVFENFMLEHAIDFYDKTKDAENEKDETKYCAGVIIFSWTFLEGYINCFINHQLHGFINDLKPVDFRGLSTIQKYSFLLKMIDGEPFIRGSEPLESFILLNKIRNRLIHFEGKSESVWKDEPPKKLVKQCEQKFMVKDIRTSSLRRILTTECAKWSQLTVRDIIEYFEKRTYKRDMNILRKKKGSDSLKSLD